MNVFVLDTDLQKCAEYHTDKHIVKMITETCQLLSSAYYYTGEEAFAPYRKSHYNHPWAKWARASLNNWMWLAYFGICLYGEYKYRYQKNSHRAGDLILYMLRFPPNLESSTMTPMPLCMPDECKTTSVVESYRNYYRECKHHLFKWTGRDTPSWIEKEGVNL